MNLSQLRSRCKPHLWFQLYWVVYLVCPCLKNISFTLYLRLLKNTPEQ